MTLKSSNEQLCLIFQTRRERLSGELKDRHKPTTNSPSTHLPPPDNQHQLEDC